MNYLFFFINIFFTISCSWVNAQNIYPQDYFKNPLATQPLLAGTFGEIRTDHFHAGLDLKTRQVEGLKVFASAEGYISRIKISHWGYGKALYVTHPNGYETVYAHLREFSPKIEQYVKREQYTEESYEIELFPKFNEIPVLSDEVIGYSGNTGGSAGPHLHFEIRDHKSRPVNPMLFGIKTKDTVRPKIKSVYAYPIDDNTHIDGQTTDIKLKMIARSDGNYIAEQISAMGRIGFGVQTYDQHDLSVNRNGIYSIESYLNGQSIFSMKFDRFSFAESPYSKCFIDYKKHIEEKKLIKKLFIEPNNLLSLYENRDKDGIITVLPNASYVYKIRVADFENNDKWIYIPITGKSTEVKKKEAIEESPHYVYTHTRLELENHRVSVSFPKECFFENQFISFTSSGDTVQIGNPSTPLRKKFTLNYDVSQYKERERNHLVIAKVYESYNQYPVYIDTERHGDKVSTQAKTLGKYLLVLDSIPPTIEPLNFTDGKKLKKYRYLKLKIKDNFSGIKGYRATVNGQWILMEYEPKEDLLVHDFNDQIVAKGKNNFRLIIIDNAGNTAYHESIFYR